MKFRLSSFARLHLMVLLIFSTLSNAAEYDSFGGIKTLEGKETGFFHIDKMGDRYFLVTPQGHGYRALGINHFHKMTSKDYDGAVQNIKTWGFNAGCYQGPRWMWERYPYTKGINLVPICQWMPNKAYGYRDVFDSSFLEELDRNIRRIVEPQKDNEYLIGYFWTDIPNWERSRNGEDWISFYKSLPKASAGGKVWRDWKKRNPKSDENQFLAVIAKQLYSKAYATIRKYDPNHIIMGDRYHEIDMPEHVVKEALPYIDAIAIQPTSREFNYDFFDKVYKKYGKPIYIADHVSSFATQEYPVTMGQATQDPVSYMEYYERYVTAALSLPYLIGYNKCQYQDEITPGGEMLKQGVLKMNESPYPILDGVTAANRKALDLAYRGE
ncbi:hypothetical protein [Pelagicoccus mobilis]|uniref:Agarase n=1 Tax=Pelagicoccus mobilis TaxID=415221 RepID=A0A934VNX7_9BACT|nr:hypothetical protein [Pelagicoccus mobilis]MBK1875225.1 hypothetical protein [Pelagicoccus mobilis]